MTMTANRNVVAEIAAEIERLQRQRDEALKQVEEAEQKLEKS
jgi:hypothetical protein